MIKWPETVICSTVILSLFQEQKTIWVSQKISSDWLKNNILQAGYPLDSCKRIENYWKNRMLRTKSNATLHAENFIDNSID